MIFRNPSLSDFGSGKSMSEISPPQTNITGDGAWTRISFASKYSAFGGSKVRLP